MKIAIVHDYLNQRGGAERVVATLHEMFPEAEIHTLFVDRSSLWPTMQDADIRPSMLQRFPLIMRHFKLFFWLYPFIIKNIKVRNCDVIISSSSAYAKGVRIRGVGSFGQKPIHVCYCHTPMRFAWDYERYIANETRSKLLAKVASTLVPVLKRWDVATAKNVDFFVANSSVVRDRIWNVYKRHSVVIHPPVDMRTATSRDHVDLGDYFLVVSRLVSYKRIDLAVQACTEMNVPLVVIGRGPDRERLESMAGPKVSFMGFQPDEIVARYMAECKALIFPGEEDFGITPLEVNSLGRPVVAYAAGGALDTIEECVNGLFFHEPTVSDLKATLRWATRMQWNSEEIRSAAQRFSKAVFTKTFTRYLEDVVIRETFNPKRMPYQAGKGLSV